MTDLERRVTRRHALRWVGGLGLAALASACSGKGGSSGQDETASVIQATTERTPAATPDCVLMPELTEGPYYLDLDLVRRDIGEDRPGLPLDLRVNVVDADACEPLEGAAVDLWHCDAAGIYSGGRARGRAASAAASSSRMPTASRSSVRSSRAGTRGGRFTST